MNISQLEAVRLQPKDITYDIDHTDVVVREKEKGCFDYNLWNSFSYKPEFIILELGSWYGYGASNLSTFLKSKNLNFRIFCVDTWLGSPEHIYDQTAFQELKLKNGYPQFYFDFLKIVKHYNHEDVIIPFPNTTTAALNYLRKNNIKFDYVIIDASHQYEDVKNDLNIAWQLVKDDGIIVGDDLNWEGVNKALREFINENKIEGRATPHGQFFIKK